MLEGQSDTQTPATYSETMEAIKELSIAVHPDQELKDLLKDYDILSLHEILENNSITTEVLWDLEEDHLKEMGMNVGDRLKYNKAKNQKNQRDAKIRDLLKQDEKGDTGLRIAVANNNIEEFQEIIEQATQLNILEELINKTDNDGRSPLYVASWKGRNDIAQLLLSNGADINLLKKDGTSPLSAAAQYGHSNVVQTLLSNKADINLSDKDGTSPLFVAAQEGHSNVVQTLINNNASIDQAKNNGVTPLYMACTYGHLEVVQLLLNNKADPYKTRDEGDTPIFKAAQKGHTKIVEKLLDNNFPINHKNFKNLTVLHVAAWHNKSDVVKLICERDEKKELINDNLNDWNHTPLTFGIANAAGIDVLRVLINYGADLTKKGNGKTPLQLAEEKERAEDGKSRAEGERKYRGYYFAVAKYIRSVIEKNDQVIEAFKSFKKTI